MCACIIFSLFVLFCLCTLYFMSTSVLCTIIFAGVVCIVMSAGVLCIVMSADEFDKCAGLKCNRINMCVIIKFLAYGPFQLV